MSLLIFLLSPYCINTGLIGKVFPPEICKINSYLETGSKPVNTRAEWGLSHSGTESVWDVAENMIYSRLRLPILLMCVKDVLHFIQKSIEIILIGG